MIISHKYRFIFLRTEKTAGTSLTSSLQALTGPEDLTTDMKRPAWAKYSPVHHGALKRNFPKQFGLHPHATAAQIRSVVGAEVFDSYHKFAIERNPWDRQVSLYFHREWKKKNENTDFSRDMTSWWYRNTEYTRLHNWKMYAIGGQIVADRILRYETLTDDIATLWQDLGLPGSPKMPRKRSYTEPRPHYSTYYTDEARALVARWYKREIDALGYQFETEPKADITHLGAAPDAPATVAATQ